MENPAKHKSQEEVKGMFVSPSNFFRKLTIAEKLWLPVGFLIFLLIASGVVSYFLVQKINANVDQMVNIQEPLEQATLEMEINAEETARAVLDYMRDLDVEKITKVNDSENDFEKFYAIFEKLAETDEEKQLGQEVAKLYREFKGLGERIISNVKRRQAGLVQFRKDVKEIHRIIDTKLQKAYDKTGPEAMQKLEAALNMEISIDKAFAAIEGYMLQSDPLLKQEVLDAEANFQKFEAIYRETSLSENEKKLLNQIGQNFTEAVGLGNNILENTDRLNRLLEGFAIDLEAIDVILDDQIQPLIHAETIKAAEDAKASAGLTVNIIIILGIIAILVGSVLVWILSGSIVKPIYELVRGTEIIGQGDLKFRMDIKSRDELGLLAQMFNEMTNQLEQQEERKALIEALEEKSAEMEEFTYTVSHDLKSPLISISGFAGLLEKDLAKGNQERVNQDIAHIRNAVEKMQKQLNELLDLSRIGRVFNLPEQVDLNQMVREIMKNTLTGQIKQRGVEVDIIPNLPPIYGDPPRLLDMMQNLLDNAVRHMGDQSQPRITIGFKNEENSDGPVFYVRDNGPGIDPRYHHRVFKIFEKLDPNSNGTGIGLAIVKRVVDTHHGRIWIESEGQGNGCTFYFQLPSKKETLDHEE